jgi:hypothetical protein
MKPKDVIAYYGSVARLAKAVDLTTQAIYYWKKVDRVPVEWQYRLEEDTKGELKRNRKAA